MGKKKKLDKNIMAFDGNSLLIGRTLLPFQLLLIGPLLINSKRIVNQ